jgi:hypothetical protein
MNYAGLTPDGVTEAAGTAQILEAIEKGFAVGPGKFVRWFIKDTPATTGDRVILLSGQGVLRASYSALDAKVYCGDPANATAEYFYHADDAAGTTRNTSGVYLILPESMDYVLPNAPRITSSFWHTTNGYGSTNNKIPKFTTEVEASNDVVITLVNSATDGLSITANMDCILNIDFTSATGVANAYRGISINSSELTTTIQSITTADRLALVRKANDSVLVAQVNISKKINSGDIVRPHTDGGAFTNDSQGCIIITATELPRENSNTIMGITY